MVIDLELDLLLIACLLVGLRLQDLDDDSLGLLPVMGEIDLGIGTLIDLLLDLVALV